MMNIHEYSMKIYEQHLFINDTKEKERINEGNINEKLWALTKTQYRQRD